MSNDRIKNSAIPLAGYAYQTLQGVKLLCDWLDEPSRYQRVRFECDDTEVAPQGLDDIVAERGDSLFDLYQVKYTPNTDNNPLTWDWLLEVRGKPGGRARSNLRKWFDAFNSYPADKLGAIQLLTNRVPDAEMEACLSPEARLDPTKAIAAVRDQILQQLGVDDRVATFFAALAVKHSDKSFSNLHVQVDGRMRRHGTNGDGLKNRATRWAIERDSPPPDGWISLAIVREIIEARLPQPVPETFAIPPDYAVPDESFHETFMRAVLARNGAAIVLKGPPGRGKSTYLSWVFHLLRKRDIPVVRHHYYLSATDLTEDRFTSHVVQQSLLSQLKELARNASIGETYAFVEGLSACAEHFASEGKPLVVIMDGLDHVWRSYEKDKRPLDDVFQLLLPIHPNVILLIGTQPVEDAQLPTRLLAEVPRSAWHELPGMSGTAVLQYLRRAVDIGRLRLEGEASFREDELVKSSQALRDRTGGHPLHVIYAIEEVIATNTELSQWTIERLAGDLSKDAQTYYRSLWSALKASERDAVQLVCAFPFFWPAEAFADIARQASLAVPSLGAIAHLMHRSEAGLKPFHESLVVFVREPEIAQARIDQLSAFVEDWLENRAAPELRINWLWLVQARRGRPQNLIAGLSRDWVLSRLVDGYPRKMLESLLKAGEEPSMMGARYADAYRLRHLEHRVSTISYQLEDVAIARLLTCTWQLAGDVGVVKEAVASRHESEILELAALAVAAYRRSDNASGQLCIGDAIRLYEGDVRFRSGASSRESLQTATFLIGAIAEVHYFGSNAEKYARVSPQLSWEGRLRVLAILIDQEQLDVLVAATILLTADESHQDFSNACVRAASLQQADLTGWSVFPDLRDSTLVACLAALSHIDYKMPALELDLGWLDADYYERMERLARLVHEWFFKTLLIALTADGEFSLIAPPKFKGRPNLSEYLSVLSELAQRAAKALRAGQHISFADVFASLQSTEVADFGSHDMGSVARDFRKVLPWVAMDCHLLSARLDGAPRVGAAEFRRAKQFRWFDIHEFCELYASSFPRLLEDDAAEILVEDNEAELRGRIDEETGPRTLAMLDQCEVALRHQLTATAQRLLQTIWDLALGCGTRRDPQLLSTLDAIEYLADVLPNEARRLLKEVSPQVHSILDYTDGKETRHALQHTDRLLAKLDRSALTTKFREHANDGDWTHADQSFEAFIASTPPNEVADTLALMRLGLAPELVQRLRARAGAGSKILRELVETCDAHQGNDLRVFVKEERSSSSLSERQPLKIDYDTFEPAELDALLKELKDEYGLKREALQDWYVHWESRGRGSDLLAALEPRLSLADGVDSDLRELGDRLASTKMRLLGPKRTFSMWVQSQISNGGWLGHMSEQASLSEARLAQVAKAYPLRGDEFIQRSTFSRYAPRHSSRVIPGDILVYYFLQLGRNTEAVQYVEEMVRTVQGDTRTLPLQLPQWGRDLGESRNETGSTPMAMLVAHLRWPIPSTKWWALQELSAKLLNPSTSAAAVALVGVELEACRLEAETVEILTAVWLAKVEGFRPPDDLIARVRAPSLLSALFIYEIFGQRTTMPEPTGVAPTDFEVAPAFERAVYSPSTYTLKSTLEDLEQKSHLPFFRQLQYEWTLNRSAYPDAPLQMQQFYFASIAERELLVPFASRSSLRVHSAYLRTLQAGVRHWKLTPRGAQSLANKALPINPALASLRPNRPDWLSDIFGLRDAAKTADFATLLAKIDAKLGAGSPGKVLLALTTPLFASEEEIVSLEVIRWAQFKPKAVDARALQARFDESLNDTGIKVCISSLLERLLHVEASATSSVIDAATSAQPTALPFIANPSGYLHAELYPTKLHHPVITSGDVHLGLRPAKGHLVASLATKGSALSIDMAEIHFWNAAWTAAHFRLPRAMCGSALVADLEALPKLINQPPCRYFYLWKVTALKRNRHHEPFLENIEVGSMTL